jgi:hypothetical protein
LRPENDIRQQLRDISATEERSFIAFNGHILFDVLWLGNPPVDYAVIPDTCTQHGGILARHFPLNFMGLATPARIPGPFDPWFFIQ